MEEYRDCSLDELAMDIIIQARMGSERLPGKVLMKLCGKEMLEHIVLRARKSKYAKNVIVATTNNDKDKEIIAFCQSKGIKCFAGDESNVLERYYKCAEKFNSDVIMRLTGDNAIVDSKIIDEGFEYFINNNYDYVFYRQGLPIGLAVEIFSREALNKAYLEAKDEKSKEHVTYYMYTNDGFNSKKAGAIGEDYSHIRLTMDTKADYGVIKTIYERLYYDNKEFSIEDVYALLRRNPSITDENKNIVQRS